MKPIPRIRLLGKKRGDRRTGSRLAGSLGEAVFFGVLFLLGITSLTALITSQLLNPTPEIYRPGFGFWLIILVLSSFTLIGGFGVLWTVAEAGASAERRSALVRRAANLDLLSDALPSPQNYPTVPRDTRLTDSPGVALNYRLPTARRTAWRLATFAGLSLLLSGFACVLSVLFVQTWRAGNAEWFVLAFALPFLLTGTWAVREFLYSIRHHSRVGATLVEISDLPLRPGGEYELFISQSGRYLLEVFELRLVCEEESTYHQGTDIRTETRTVYECQVLSRDQIELEFGQPLEIDEVLTIPRSAIHSFQSAHNAIRWKLVVRGTPRQGPIFERVFPLPIYPPGQDERASRRQSEQVHHGTPH